MNRDQYLTVTEAAGRLGVSRSTLWRWMAERGLKALRVGGVTRIRVSDLESFCQRHSFASEARQPDTDGHPVARTL